jgi:phage repressor protein C with HTH and peptisase S24 domain
MAQMYQIPEYRDPQGATLPPWGEPYVLSQAICDRLGVDPHSLMIFQQADNSNYQRIRRGDVCVIDTSQRQPKDGQKFLIEHAHGSRIRRLFCHHDGSIDLAPDTLSPTFRAETVMPDYLPKLRIIGMVVLVVSFSD